MALIYGNIPEDLKRCSQWVVHKDKIPHNPGTGYRASVTDPSTWGTFEAACEAVEKGSFSGIGFVFTENDPFVGVDFDHCISDGKLDPWVQQYLDKLESYTELSPSGTGLHVICRGNLPGRSVKTPQAEMYDKSRYFTFTGNTYGRPRAISASASGLTDLYGELSKRPSKGQDPTAPAPKCPVQLSDTELLEKAYSAQNGDRFQALYAGDLSQFSNDHSRADMALCNLLAYWTNGDIDRMDRLFRQSGLMRDKWDRRQSGSTYGRLQLEKAVADMRQGYDPERYRLQRTLQAFSDESNSSGLSKLIELHPERNDRYPWNDIGNGNLFADCYRGEARYVPERKKWFVFNGCVWKPDTGNLRVMELCKQLADALVCYALSLPEGAERDSYRKFVEVWQRRNHRETILKDAASVFPVRISEFDADPYLFNCSNGTLDLKTRELRPHSADDLLTMVSGVKYDSDAGSEIFEKFLLQVMCSDKETAAYVQKVLGYCLTGDTSEECFFTFYGATTRNGKSTLLETFLRLLGDYGRSAKPETFALKKTVNGSGPSEDLARLAGARMISVSEVPRGMHLDASLMKTITGGDTITARFLCENSFEYRPQFKQIFNTNWLPTASDVTLFSSDRVRVIPFERHFKEEERDKTLKSRLSTPISLSGILNWCLDGLQMWRETGLEPSAAVKKATAQYQLDSDKIAQFIDEELEAGPEYEVKSSEAFAQYKYWCSQNGYHYGSDRTWKDDMKRLVVFERRRPRSGGDKTTMIRGYRLK